MEAKISTAGPEAAVAGQKAGDLALMENGHGPEAFLKIFENEKFGKLRITDQDGEPWFVASDVAMALGYANPQEATRDHCKKVNKISQPSNSLTPVHTPPTFINIIPESDVYRLVMRSKLPAAEDFQDWLVEEVLPSIRKTGKYSAAKDELTRKDRIALAEKLLDLSNIAKPLAAVILNEFVACLYGYDALSAMQINFSSCYGEENLTSRSMAKQIRGYSETGIDYQLKKMGLQVEDEFGNFWIPTKRGEKYGIVSGSRKPRGYYPVSNIRWKPIVIHLLRLFMGSDPGFGNTLYGVGNVLEEGANNR